MGSWERKGAVGRGAAPKMARACLKRTVSAIAARVFHKARTESPGKWGRKSASVGNIWGRGTRSRVWEASGDGGAGKGGRAGVGRRDSEGKGGREGGGSRVENAGRGVQERCTVCVGAEGAGARTGSAGVAVRGQQRKHNGQASIGERGVGRPPSRHGRHLFQERQLASEARTRRGRREARNTRTAAVAPPGRNGVRSCLTPFRPRAPQGASCGVSLFRAVVSSRLAIVQPVGPSASLSVTVLWKTCGVSSLHRAVGVAASWNIGRCGSKATGEVVGQAAVNYVLASFAPSLMGVEWALSFHDGAMSGCVAGCGGG